MYSPNSAQQENFSNPPDNTSKFKAARKLFAKETHNSPTSSPYNFTPTASPKKSNLTDANEILSRPQRNRKAPTFFGEPIPSDLLHKLKKKYRHKISLNKTFYNKSVPTHKTVKK